jgi:hypothetical protein
MKKVAKRKSPRTKKSAASSYNQYLRLQLPKGYKIPKQHAHQDVFTTIREATHRGKAIRVETTYKILIDGKPVTSHTHVLDDGSVHSHALPNYSFRSAVDLARKIVDTSNIEVPKNELGKPGSSPHGGHH